MLGSGCDWEGVEWDRTYEACCALCPVCAHRSPLARHRPPPCPCLPVVRGPRLCLHCWTHHHAG
eukprot:6218588-Pyramimonas_sp.AAC.1